MANLWTQFSEQVRYLLYGPGSATPSSTQLVPLPPSPVRTSLVFESHIQEASSSAKSKHPQTISLAYDERGRYEVDGASKSWQGMTPLERKEVLIGIYLANPWVSACIDVIANRICSGGFTVEPIEKGKGNPKHHDQLQEFCLRVNDDWDLLQYVRCSLVDLLIFGETYTEIVWKGGLPYQLYSIDCLTMGFKADPYGRIIDFRQQLPSDRQIHSLGTDNIIRWWRPHPRAKIDPFSPIEKIQDAIWLDKTMVNWQQTFFKKGARFPYYLKGIADENEAERFKQYFKENNTGAKNAHEIPLLWGNAEIVALGQQGALQLDFESGQDRQRTIVFAGFQVPPAAVSIIESGNIGGGTGEDQDKSLQNNACDPLKNAFLEKFNYRIVQGGFGITDYKIGLRYAEYRSDEQIAKVQDMRIKNGSRTIDEVRQEDGKEPYEIGGSVPFVWSNKELTPVARLNDLEEESRQTAQATLQSAQAQADLAQTKAKQAKEPPEPVPPALSNSAQQTDEPNEKLGEKQAKNAVKQGQKQDESLGQETQGNTGVMVALMIPPEIGQQIAISGGEPVEDLHITLAMLGDVTDLDSERVEHLKAALKYFAASRQPLYGRIAGLGRFDGSGDEASPVIALPDIPSLPAFRQQLVDLLAACETPAQQNHGYTPHITLAYIDKSAPMPIADVPHLNLYFGAICLAVGDERTFFPLLGQKVESQEDAPLPVKLWIMPGLELKLQQLQAEGVVSVTWHDHLSSCDQCEVNNGETRRLGETFPSGHQMIPAHPHCVCSVTYTYADGSTRIEKSPYGLPVGTPDPDAVPAQEEEDKDATQKLPAIKIKREVK